MQSAALRTSGGFNGSTVGEPWLGPFLEPWQRRPSRFNGSTVGEPWLGTEP